MPDLGILKGLRAGAKKARVPRGAADEATARAAAQAEIEAEARKGTAEATGSQDITEGYEQTEVLEQAAEQAATPVNAPRLGPTDTRLGALQRALARAKAARQPQGGPPPPVQAETATGPPAGPIALAGAEVEAKRLSTLELGDYDLEAVHQINFDRLTTTDDVKAVIADAGARNAGRIDASRRGVIANEQLALLAADLDVEQDVIRTVIERESGEVINPERILGARQVLASSADRVLNLAKKIASGQGTDLDRVQFRRQVQFHDDFQIAFMGARAETGRALNAFNIPVGAELDGEWLARAARTVDNLNGNDTAELAQMISQMESVGQVSKLTRQYNRSKVAGVLQEVFVNSILSGPKTSFVNTIGNALFQGMNTIEYGVAAQVGKMLPGAEHVEVGEASAMLFGQLTGWRDAMRYTWLAFKNGESVDQVVKYEGHTKRAISSQNLFPKGAPPSVAAAVDIVGNVIRAPTERLMVSQDEFFKTLAYRGDLARQAFLEVNQRIAGGNAMSQAEIAEHVRNFMENPSYSAKKKADDYARYVTFQTELGIGGRAAQRFVASTPGGFVIAPFVRTPTNIFKAGLMERSPLAIFSNNFWQAMQRGGPERDLAVARVSMGTLTVGAVAAATAAGHITGGGPQDPGARRLLEATGWQPYSFVYEDGGEIRYQSYARAEPFAYIVGATADAVEIRAFMDAEDPLASDNEILNQQIAAVTAAVANNSMSKTFLSGVADFSQALDDPSRYMKGWLDRTSQAFIPYSAFRRQVGQMQDPLIREAWTYNDKLLAGSGYAGYSEGLPPRRDIFGGEIEWKGGSVLGVMSPFPDTTDKADPVADEIVSVMQETGSIPVTMPSKKIEGMALTAEEYDQLVLAARSQPNFAGSLTFHERLADLISGSSYLLAPPEFKAVLIKQIREDADEIGRSILERDNPEFADRIALHRLKKQELMRGLP